LPIKPKDGWRPWILRTSKQTLTDVSDEIIEPTDDGEWSMILLRKIRSLQINLDDMEKLRR
jgi:hypothetical protein